MNRIINFLFFLVIFALITSVAYNIFYTKEIKRLQTNFYFAAASDSILNGIIKQVADTGGLTIRDKDGNILLQLKVAETPK